MADGFVSSEYCGICGIELNDEVDYVEENLCYACQDKIWEKEQRQFEREHGREL